MTKPHQWPTRFYAKLQASSDGCLEWQGAVGPHGYGVVGVAGQSIYTHRAAWALAYGPVPDGMSVLHICDNRRCCNPDHLFLGTHGQNMDDMVTKRRSATGEQHSQAKLTDQAVLEIRERAAAGEPIKAIAEQYSISVRNTRDVVRRHTWKHL